MDSNAFEIIEKMYHFANKMNGMSILGPQPA